MRCSQCGGEVESGMAHCPWCGAAQSNVAGVEVNISDSAVAGDVNIVQNFEADVEEMVGRLVGELQKVDWQEAGFRVPDSGITRTDVEPFITAVRENPLLIESMDTDPLLSFGCLLDAMGWPGLNKRIGTILLSRDEVNSDPERATRGHLISARAAMEAMEHRGALIHLDKAMTKAIEANSLGLISYCIYLMIRCKGDLGEDTTDLEIKASNHLARIGPSEESACSWAHLALSLHHSGNRPDLSEHHEVMAYHLAMNRRDIEARVASLLASSENRIWRIDNQEWPALRSETELNGLSHYSFLLDLAVGVEGSNTGQTRAKLRVMSRECEERGLKELHIMAWLIEFITRIGDVLSETPHGSALRQSAIDDIINDSETSKFMDQIIASGYHALDEIILFQFLRILHTGTALPPLAADYLKMTRGSTDLVVSFMLDVHDAMMAGENPIEVLEHAIQMHQNSPLREIDTSHSLLVFLLNYHRAVQGAA